MWLFLSTGFLSVVQDSTNKNNLVVRARRKGDIEKVFPGAEVVTLRARDYQFRAFIPREQVAEVVAKYVMDLGYTNFKSSINRRTDGNFERACHEVWDVMAELQPKMPYSM